VIRVVDGEKWGRARIEIGEGGVSENIDIWVSKF